MADRGTPPLAMERVGSLRILGVAIASDLSVSAHVDALPNAGARSIYQFPMYYIIALHLCTPSAESARVARPCAKDRCKGNDHQPHPKCGPCMEGLCQRRRQGTNPAISRADVQIRIPDRARH